MRLILILNKGKARPIGSVSPSGKTKKTTKGWVPVKKDVARKSKYFKMTPKELRHTDISNFVHGDRIKIGDKYELALRKVKYKTFSLESSLMGAGTFKHIDPAFWPMYVNDFLHGDFKKSMRLIYPISKAKARPTGSVSPSGKYKKAPSGKWVPIKKEGAKGSGLEKAVKEAYDWIFDRTDNKFEAMVLLNEKGEHIARRVGGKSHVDLDGLGHLMNGCTLLHNHPMGWSFSSSDLFVALTTGLKEIRAVCTEYEYIYRPDKVISRKDVYAITVFNKFFVKENRELAKKYKPKISSGELTAEVANTCHFHDLIANYVKWYGGFYERRKR